MAEYKSNFVRLTFGGPLRSVEQWTCNLSVGAQTDELPTAAQLEQVWSAWVTNIMSPDTGGTVVGSSARLDYVKAAVIGTNGRYVSDVPRVHDSGSSGWAGAGPSTYPPQVALAVTLLGTSPRGAAGRGRIYLPDPVAPVNTDGRIDADKALTAANAVARLINSINATLDGAVIVNGAATAKGRAPATQTVAAVRVGRVLDTMRSRRSSMPEEPVMADVAVTGFSA